LTLIMDERSGAPPVPQAVQAYHDLLAWLIPLLDQFPRTRRFTLGVRLESGLLRVLQALVEAAYSRDRRELLLHANRELSVNRHLWQLAFELKVIASRRYEHGARMIDELGRQFGGWLRSQGQDR
jgi:hypothetical protein